VLRCDINMKAQSATAFAQSIAMASKLGVLQIRSSDVGFAVCAQMHKQREAVINSTGGSGSGSDGCGGPVLLRELHLPRCDIDQDELQHLSTLPHLERLFCTLDRDSISGLGGLRALRSLTLLGCNWGDVDLRIMGRLPLPLLSTLELRARCKEVLDLISVRKVNRATPSSLTTAGGVRHLLQLPSLTRLRLPLLSREARSALHSLLTHSGRIRTLRVEVEKDDEGFGSGYAAAEKKCGFLFLCTDGEPSSATTVVLNDY